jgi:hypothetical protein
MCDYSLTNVKSRPAVVGDKLVTNNFGTGTCGFAPEGDMTTAVCVLPGTELAFDEPVIIGQYGSPPAIMFVDERILGSLARFRQVDKETERAHHDALEFESGEIQKLTYLPVGLHATVLQLPAAPKTEQEAKDQERLAVVG